MILVYRNADSPEGDFGLVKQEGDERFVVLTPEEYCDLRARVEAAEGALAEARLACADLCRARADAYAKEGKTLKGLEKVLVLSREAAALSCEGAILTALRASGTREGE